MKDFLSALRKKKSGSHTPLKEFKLNSKTFYSAEVAILEQYFPLSEKIQHEMTNTYDNQRSYITYYFDGATLVAIILWLDDWKSFLSDEDRLELFTLMDEPFTESAYIAAFEVNNFFHNQGYGRAVMKDFQKNKRIITLSAIDGSEGFYKKCGFNVDRMTNYYFLEAQMKRLNYFFLIAFLTAFFCSCKPVVRPLDDEYLYQSRISPDDLIIDKRTFARTGFVNVIPKGKTAVIPDGKNCTHIGDVFHENRTITLNYYSIGKYEVTQELYEFVMKKIRFLIKKINMDMKYKG